MSNNIDIEKDPRFIVKVCYTDNRTETFYNVLYVQNFFGKITLIIVDGNKTQKVILKNVSEFFSSYQ